MWNSEADRVLEDPRGWNDAGYVPSNHRPNNNANNIGSYYLKTKANMGGRVPREIYGISPVLIGTLEDPLKTKRFSGIAMGIGGIAVSQVAQLIGTAYLGSRVSELEQRIDAANIESIRA